jgi:integrase
LVFCTTQGSGSRADCIQENNSTIIHFSDCRKTLHDFYEYLNVVERLSKKVCGDYRGVARRFLKHSSGILFRESILGYLKTYLDKKHKTYNNIIDALKAFIGRFLKRNDLIERQKHTYVPAIYERPVPTKEQVKKGFEALTTDKERAIYLFYATTGLRKSEALNLTKDDVDFDMRCVKAKHDTRTKSAGVSFYNEECEQYLKKYLDSRTDNKNKLFRIDYRQFQNIWKKSSEAAGIKITPQVMRKWHSSTLGELMVPDRYVDIFQGRAPRSVLAKHYTGKGLDLLKRVYVKTYIHIL